MPSKKPTNTNPGFQTSTVLVSFSATLNVGRVHQPCHHGYISTAPQSPHNRSQAPKRDVRCGSLSGFVLGVGREWSMGLIFFEGS